MPFEYFYILSGLSYMAVTLAVLLYLRKIYIGGGNSELNTIVSCAAFNGLITFVLAAINIRVSDMYLVFSVLMLAELVLIFKQDKEGLLACVVHISLHITATRNFSVSLLAIINDIPLNKVLLNIPLRFTSLLLSMVILFGFLLFFAVLIPVSGIMRLLEHKKQLRQVYTIGIVLIAYQIFCTKAFYYNINILWFSFLQLFGSLLIILGYYFLYVNSLRSSVWLNEVWRYATLERQLERQLTHYKAYERSEQTVRIFKHDYNKLISGVSTLLFAEKNEQALALLEQMDHVLQNDVKVHLHYSSNLFIDAAMQELANECSATDISFKAGIYPPPEFCLSALECSTLFSLMAKLVFDECFCCANTNKYISFVAGGDKRWFTVVAEFSCNTQSFNAEKASKFFEYDLICRTAEKYGGFADITLLDNCAKLSANLSFHNKGGESN